MTVIVEKELNSCRQQEEPICASIQESDLGILSYFAESSVEKICI